jgi:hypothetical protein
MEPSRQRQQPQCIAGDDGYSLVGGARGGREAGLEETTETANTCRALSETGTDDVRSTAERAAAAKTSSITVVAIQRT